MQPILLILGSNESLGNSKTFDMYVLDTCQSKDAGDFDGFRSFLGRKIFRFRRKLKYRYQIGHLKCKQMFRENAEIANLLSRLGDNHRRC